MAHWKSGQKAQKGHTPSVLRPIWLVGLSSQALISLKVERAAMPDRSGPALAPRPLTIWQPEQPLSPKKNFSPADTCSGGAVRSADSFMDLSQVEISVTWACGR